MEDETQFIDYIENISYYVNNSYHTAIKLQNKNYWKIENDLNEFFDNNFYNFQGITFYGSRIAGIASHNSDLDVCVQFASSSRYIFYKALSILQQMSYPFEYQFCYPSVPLIRANHVETQVSCDLVFKWDLSREKAIGLDNWLNIQEPEARKFLLFIRDWFAMSDSFFDSRYHKMLDMMSVFWLIRKNVLPPFEDMQADSSDPQSIEFYSHNRDHYNINYMHDFRDYIEGFFSFYGNFDFSDYIICPYLGQSISKGYFKDHPSLCWRDDTHDLNDDASVIVLSFLDMSRNFAWMMDYEDAEQLAFFCRRSQSVLSRFNYYN